MHLQGAQNMDARENTISSLDSNTRDVSNNGAHGEADVALTSGAADETTTVIVVPNIRFPSCRLVLVAMGFFALFNCSTLRVNLSVAITDMVNYTYLHELVDRKVADAANWTDYNYDDRKPPCALTSAHNITSTVERNTHSTIHGGIFNWDWKTQGRILSAYYYGYVPGNIAGGFLAQLIGGKLSLLLGLFAAAILSLLTPVLTALGGFWAIFFVSLLQGIGAGVTFPAMAMLLSAWTPPLQRSRMFTFVYAGLLIGTFVGVVALGILCHFFGWKSVFYVPGAIAVMWAIMWFFLVYNSPDTHPRISREERQYIEKTLNKKTGAKGTVCAPWLSMATSLPLYALCVAHFAYGWGYYTLLTGLPVYFKHHLRFDIKNNILLGGAPYLFMWIMMLLSGAVADLLQKILSTTNVRKLAIAVGFVLPGICLIAIGYVGHGHNWAYVVLLVTGVAVGFSGVAVSGFMVNLLELAPPYAGIIAGISITFAELPGFIAPKLVGALTYGNQTSEAWRTVFYIAAAVYLFATIFYGIFGSGELQPWAKQPESPMPQELEVDVQLNPRE